MADANELLKLIPGIVATANGGIQLDYSDLAKVIAAMAIGALGNQYIATKELAVEVRALNEKVIIISKKLDEYERERDSITKQLMRHETIIDREHSYNGNGRNKGRE